MANHFPTNTFSPLRMYEREFCTKYALTINAIFYLAVIPSTSFQELRIILKKKDEKKLDFLKKAYSGSETSNKSTNASL